MSYLDIAFLVFFVIIMIRGFFRGFIKEAISILGIFFAYYGASYVTSKYYDSYYLSGIAHRFSNQEFGKIVVFTAVFLLTVIVFAVISFVLTKIIDLVKLGFYNRMGGFFAGIKAFLLLSLILYFLFSIPITAKTLNNYKSESFIPYFLKTGKFLSPYLNRFY